MRRWVNLKRLLTGACFAAGAAAAPVAFAHGGVAVQIGVLPPPVPVVAYMPPPRYGYVWVPGYWTWHRHHHVWKRGHWVRHKHGHGYAHRHHRHYDRYAYRY